MENLEACARARDGIVRACGSTVLVPGWRHAGVLIGSVSLHVGVALAGVRVGIGEGDRPDGYASTAGRPMVVTPLAGPTTTGLRLHFSDLCHALLTYATPGRSASRRHAPTRRAPHRVRRARTARTRPPTHEGCPAHHLARRATRVIHPCASRHGVWRESESLGRRVFGRRIDDSTDRIFHSARISIASSVDPFRRGATGEGRRRGGEGERERESKVGRKARGREELHIEDRAAGRRREK